MSFNKKSIQKITSFYNIKFFYKFKRLINKKNRAKFKFHFDKKN